MCIKLSEASKFDFNLSSKEELYLNVGGGFSRRRKIIEKRLKKEINFRSLSTKSRMSKARLKLNLFDLISCGQHNFKKVMINSTLFAFLVLFAGALSKNSEQRDINGLRGRRDTDDKLWTFESAEKNGRTILNPNYVYELKSDISSSINNQSDRTLMMRDLTSIDGEDEEDNDTSASMLKPSHKSNVGPTKSPNNNNHGLEQLENVSSNHTKGYNNKSSIASNNTKVKKSKSKYLKSPSRKVSLSSFLPKSKRQDSSKVVIPSNENNRTKVEQIANSRSYEPFLSTSGVPSQPLIPYPTGSSLMFGPSTAQIPLPTFFNFPQAHPLPIMSLNNQHHPNHQPRIPLHGINPYEAQNTAQMIEQLQKHIRLETTRHNERPFVFPSSELQTGQHQHQHQHQQPQQQQPEPQRVQPQPQLQPQQQPQPVQQQQVFKRDEPKNNYDSMKSSSVQNPDISSHQASATMGSPSAAVALLSERAKSLLSQMSLSNQLAASHLHLTPTNIRNNRDTTSSNIKQSSTNDMGLSSMIKTAAEQWAAKNTGTDSTPTIIVEHDGPTITSVDFNGNNNLPQAQPIQPQLVENNQSDPPEDDDVTSFYSEENEETEGSNDAKRIVKFKQHQHPFMQQSNVVQSDSPFGEDFFDANNGIFGAKRMVPVVGNHQVSNQHSANNNRNPSNDISQDYVRFHKYLDQSPATYPDSINAIKEQSGRDNELISVVSNKIDVTDKEQVDQLIRELQNLNRRRRKNEGSPEIDSDLDSDSRRVKSFNIDDSDDYKGNRNNDDDEDEQIRLIRKKLLARLNRKRKAKFESDSDPASSYVSDQAIKIPLHALLLAALDRRMSSPSEQTRIVDISDGKNKNTLKNNQISFSSPIMNANNVVETTMKTRNGPKMRANTAGILRAFNRSDAASNLSQLKNPDIFYILDNFGFPGALSAKSRGNNSSSDAVIDVNSNRGSRSGSNSNYINNNLNNNNNTYNDGNTDYDRSKDGEGNQSQSTDQEQQNISATTRTPTATTASETFQRRPPDKESARQQESQQQEQDNDTTKGTSTRESGAKGRRDVAGGNDEGNNDGNRGTDNDGDFDVDKQVNEFSNDRNESPLEPSWARNGINKQQERNRKRNDPSVDFDDDFEDLASKSAASNTRKRVLKRRRLPPKLREGAYEQSGNNFLNKLDKDTADSGGEIDRNTLGIDDPIVPENEDQRVQQNREDDDLHEDDDKDRHRDDDGDGESNERRPEENDNNRSGAETRTNQIITWKPHMIDDEVRRIEIIAERRRAGRDKQEQLERRRGNRMAYQ